jgi:hypothetical protein
LGSFFFKRPSSSQGMAERSTKRPVVLRVEGPVTVQVKELFRVTEIRAPMRSMRSTRGGFSSEYGK